MVLATVFEVHGYNILNYSIDYLTNANIDFHIMILLSAPQMTYPRTQGAN